jgi:hypothetical protein
VWLACDGLGLMPILLLLRSVELPGRGVSVTTPVAVLMAFGGMFAGITWLCVMTGLRAWQRRSTPPARALLAAGLCLSYLLMSLVHYLFATPPGYRYISAASNFFAFNLVLQIVVFAAAAGSSIGITRLRNRYLPA